ncbi:MAG: hypothetical protein ABIV11_11170, partial [Gemmatimonadaceae bacterium]
YLAEAYSDLGKHDSAGLWLRSALAHGYSPDHAFVREVANQLAVAGKPRAGAELALDYLVKKSGTPFLWSVGSAQSDFGNAEFASLAADLFSAAGDSAKANVIRASARGLCSRPVPLLSLGRAPSRQDRFGQAPDCREPWRSTESY